MRADGGRRTLGAAQTGLLVIGPPAFDRFAAVRTRIATRLGVLAVGSIAPVLAVAGPALASLKPDDGSVPGPSLGAGLTILIFVVIPVGVFLLIAGLASLPSALGKPRYRPGREWDHDPTWVQGPALDAGVASEGSARGGASAEW